MSNRLFFSKKLDVIAEGCDKGCLTTFGVIQIVFGWAIPLLLFSFIIFFSLFTIIKTSEVGIKSRFGVIISDSPLEEGVHFKVPLIDTITRFSLKQHQENFTLEHTQTKDLQPISVSYKVIYSIPKDKVIDNTKEVNGDLFDTLIRPRSNESIMDALAQYPAEDLIVNRDTISRKVKDKLTERISGHAKIDDIAIVEFDFENKDWKDSIQRKVIAKQDAEASINKKVQAQAEADAMFIRAKGEAESMKIKAQALSSNPKLIEFEKIKTDLEIAKTNIEIAKIITDKDSKWNGQLPQTILGEKSNILLPIGK
jgi:prohibitin 1